MVIREYRETLDYRYVIARQMDRVLEAYSRVNPGRATVVALERLYVAVRGLLVAATPFIDATKLAGLWEDLRAAERLIRDGSLRSAWRVLDSVLAGLLVSLEAAGLLVRKAELLTGSYGGEEE